MADLFFLSQKINSKLEREKEGTPLRLFLRDGNTKETNHQTFDIDIDRSPSPSGELREKIKKKDTSLNAISTTHSEREEEAKRENLGYF